MTGRHQTGGGRGRPPGRPVAVDDHHTPRRRPMDSYAHLPRGIRLAVAVAVLVALLACCAGGVWLWSVLAAEAEAEAKAAAVAAAARAEETAKTRRGEAEDAAKTFFGALLGGGAAGVKGVTTGRATKVFDPLVRQLKSDRAFGYSVSKVSSEGETYTVAGYTHLPKKFRPVTLTLARQSTDASATDEPARFVITNIVAAGKTSKSIPK